MPKKPLISIVVAIGRDHQHNRVIGKTNELLWHIPDDLKRFKQLTSGHPVVMGRKTYESIYQMLGKPLPNRQSVVLMREAEFNPEDPLFKYENVFVVHSPEAALEKARGLDANEIFIGGGAQIYKLFLPQVDKLYLTLIEDEKEGDAFFPEYENEFTKVTSHEHRDHEGLKYSWVDLERE